MIHKWNVLETYETGDLVLKGKDLEVMTKSGFQPVSNGVNSMEVHARTAVDTYHQSLGIPGYDEIMRVYYEAHPELLL